MLREALSMENLYLCEAAEDEVVFLEVMAINIFQSRPRRESAIESSCLARPLAISFFNEFSLDQPRPSLLA
jgi:hypothetical protein